MCLYPSSNVIFKTITVKMQSNFSETKIHMQLVNYTQITVDHTFVLSKTEFGVWWCIDDVSRIFGCLLWIRGQYLLEDADAISHLWRHGFIFIYWKWWLRETITHDTCSNFDTLLILQLNSCVLLLHQYGWLCIVVRANKIIITFTLFLNLMM